MQLVKISILFFYFLTTHSYGSIEFNKIKQSIYHCFDNSSDCQQIKVPMELNDEIDESILSIDKFLGQNYLLMTNEHNLLDRKPIIKKIAIKQAYLYDDALENSKTKMYLIEDDKVELLQYRDDFYQIRYLTKTQKLIVKWVHSSALQVH
jgi:hypothetical protein